MGLPGPADRRAHTSPHCRDGAAVFKSPQVAKGWGGGGVVAGAEADCYCVRLAKGHP